MWAASDLPESPLHHIDDSKAACRLVKAGVIPQQYARSFNLVSAWAELVGYVGSIWLNALRIAAALERERALSEELLRRKKVQHATFHDQCMSAQRSVLRKPCLPSVSGHAPKTTLQLSKQRPNA